MGLSAATWPVTSDFDFGSGDWTIEISFRADKVTGANAILSLGTLDTLEHYEASLLPTFRRFMFHEFQLPDDRATMRILAPSQIEQPDSSLSHMFGVVLDALGEPGSDFDVKNGELLFDRVLTVLVESAASEMPITLCGTAFAFVHLIDHMGQRGVLIGLPSASRIMETGGFKGRSREVPRTELYAELKRVLGIPAERIVNQYGMTELGSQF